MVQNEVGHNRTVHAMAQQAIPLTGKQIPRTLISATEQRTGYTISTSKGEQMRTTPHILYVIYKNGQKVRLNLGAQTPAERRVKLNDWAKTAGTKTAFLAWK